MSRVFEIRECPKTELKEVEERKRYSSPWMAGTIAFLLKAEAVISLYENSKNSLKILHFSRKTPASPCQCWDIVGPVRKFCVKGDKL